VAGWRSLVRGGAPYCPAAGDGDTPCVLAKLPCAPPPHTHIRREGCPSDVRYRVGAGGGGLLEELGWTGFAVPTLLRQRHGVLSTGLIVGLLWGAWHFLVAFWGSGTSSGALSLAIFLPAIIFYVGSLPAYRVLMVRVYERTGESMFVAMLMHAVFSASMLILQPLGIALVPGLIWNLVLAAVLWIFVGAVAVTQGGHLSRQPPLRRRVV
jgi:hypothetical protein